MSIAIVILTYNRVHILQQCIDMVVRRSTDVTKEIVIWNNGSTDGTRSYLDGLDDQRIRLVHHDRNIGPNAYDRAFRRTTSEYLIELDDDIIEAPEGWDATLLDAFRKSPNVGLLSANLVDNPDDVTARIMYGQNAGLYRIVETNGVRLKIGGPIGGGCAITSREIYDRVGGFGQNRRFAYWSSDAAYMTKIEAAGLRGAYLADLRVLHAGGEYYSPLPAAKIEFYNASERRARRRGRIKRVILLLPFVRALNERNGWFVPPEQDSL